MEQTNKVLLQNTAARLFSSNGYDAVGIQKIVDCAKVTKPTLYYYFKSKQGLLDAIFSDHFEGLLKELKTASISYDGDLMGALTRIVDSYVQYGIGKSDETYLQLSMTYLPASHAAHTIISAYMERLEEFFTDFFRQAVPVHGNLKDHEQILSVTLIGILNNYMIQLLNEKLSYSEVGVAALVKQYMYGIYVL